ncbi:CDPK-related kinase 3 [Tanacetum coccineum]
MASGIRSQPSDCLDMFIRLVFIDAWPGELLHRRVATTISLVRLVLALGWLLEEIHLTCAHLEKKQTRLQLYTKIKEEIVQTVRPEGVRICPDGVIGVRTYDWLNGKWKILHHKVAYFCGVYNNFTRRAYSGAGDGDYIKKEHEEYHAEYGVPFTLLHMWSGLKDCHKWKEVELTRFEEKRHENFKRYKSSGSSSFNTLQSGEDLFNLNVEAGEEEEEEVKDVRRPMDMDRAKKKAVASSIPSTSFAADSDETLASSMVTGYASQTDSFMSMKKEDHVAFLEINRMDIEMQKNKLKKQHILANQEYEQRKKTKYSIRDLLIT